MLAPRGPPDQPSVHRTHGGQRLQPSQLLAIAAKDVIRPGMLKNTTHYGLPESLILSPVPNETGLAPDGKASNVVYVKQAGQGGQPFKAYVCDYKEGELNYQVLGTDAPFCFTTTINGCTFSVGIPAPDGTVIVSHTNMKSDKMDPADLLTRGTQTQGQFQGAVATAFHGHGVVVDPTVYWNGGDLADGKKINVTVFGIFDRGWKFYFQRWTRDGTTKINKLLDLNSFDTSSVTF